MNIIDLEDKSELEILKALDISPSAFTGYFFDSRGWGEDDDDMFEELDFADKRQASVANALHITGFANAIATYPELHLNTNVDIHLYMHPSEAHKLQTVLEHIVSTLAYNKVYIHGITSLKNCKLVNQLITSYIVFSDLVSVDCSLLRLLYVEMPELDKVRYSSINTLKLRTFSITDIEHSTIIATRCNLQLGNTLSHASVRIRFSNIISKATSVHNAGLSNKGNELISLNDNNQLNIRHFDANSLCHIKVNGVPDKPKKYILANEILSEVLHTRGNIYKVRSVISEATQFLAIDPACDLACHAAHLKDAVAGLEDKRQSFLEDKKIQDEKVDSLCEDYKEFFTSATRALDPPALKELYNKLTGACDPGMEHFISTSLLEPAYTCSDFIAMLEQKKAYGYTAAISVLKLCLAKVKQETITNNQHNEHYQLSK